jgi:hypothetical protein
MRQQSTTDCSECKVKPCIRSWLRNKSKFLTSASGLAVPQRCLAVVDDQQSLMRRHVARHRPAMPEVAARFGFKFESLRPCSCCRAAVQGTCTWLRSIPARRSDSGWPGRTCWHQLPSVDPGASEPGHARHRRRQPGSVTAGFVRVDKAGVVQQHAASCAEESS